MVSLTVFPVKPWTPEKISGMFIISRPIRCEIKPQKMTDKSQQGSVKTWYETTSWPFLLRQIFNKSSIFPSYLSEKAIFFLPQTNTIDLIPSVQKPNYQIDLKARANYENLQWYRFMSWVKVTQLPKNMDQKPLIPVICWTASAWNKHRGALLVIGSFFLALRHTV